MSLITIHVHAGQETDRLLNLIFERIQTMPTEQQLVDAVKDAVVAEREQVRLAIIKAVEDALANAPQSVSEATKQAVLDAIASVYEAAPSA